MLEHLLTTDRVLFVFINSHHAGFFDIFFFTFSLLGNGWVAAPAAALAVFLFARRRLEWRIIIAVLACMLVSGVINSTIKHFSDRQRPVTYFTHHEYPQGQMNEIDVSQVQPDIPELQPRMYTVHVMGKPLRYHSFPSGHTNTVFAAVTALVFLYGGYAWFLYGIAAFVGYSRVYIGAHFPLDAAAGAIIAVVIVIAVMSIFKCSGFISSRSVPVNDKQ
jgi:membrane-associated phospholipid phosphatase